jgi:hypothetical protein
MRLGALVLGALGLVIATVGPVRSQQPGTAESSLQKLCTEPAEANRGFADLPFTAKALRERKRIRVLAIGATPLHERDQVRGHYAQVEKFLENSFKGLDVEIIDRGVSGELARDGAERIKNEVALNKPDLVFWQVGVADALALTPASELKDTLTRAVRWLKAHDVDVVLIGLRYQRSLAGHPGYQQIRGAIKDVVREEAILRIGHYESVEALDRLRRQEGEQASDLDLTDVNSICLADYLSRALAVGLFAKRQQPMTPPSAPNAGGEPQSTGGQLRPPGPDGPAPQSQGNPQSPGK